MGPFKTVGPDRGQWRSEQTPSLASERLKIGRNSVPWVLTIATWVHVSTHVAQDLTERTVTDSTRLDGLEWP